VPLKLEMEDFKNVRNLHRFDSAFTEYTMKDDVSSVSRTLVSVLSKYCEKMYST
jgi:hypothetical protein